MWLHLCVGYVFASSRLSLWTVTSWRDKAFAGMSWHVCNLASKHSAAWMIAIKVFVPWERTGHIFLLHQPVRQTHLSHHLREACWWGFACQLGFFSIALHYPDHIFQLLSGPLLWDDQLQFTHTRGKLSLSQKRKQIKVSMRVTILSQSYNIILYCTKDSLSNYLLQCAICNLT